MSMPHSGTCTCQDCRDLDEFEPRATLVQTARERDEARGRKPFSFQIRFDDSGRFVECETLDGKGVNVGHWVQDREYWLLVVEGYDAPAQLKSEVTRLTEALAAAESRRSDANQIAVELEDKLAAAEARVRELTEALAAAGRTIQDKIVMHEAFLSERNAAEARVRELEVQRAYVSQGGHWCARAETAEARVRELEAALAAEDRLASSRLKSFTDAYESNQHLKATVADKEIALDIASKRADAAEARVRELEQGRTDFINATMTEAHRAATARVEALETLLAASEARAAQWQADAEGYRADATVAQDRLAALRARVERAAAVMTLAFGSFMPEWPGAARDALEILRDA